MLKKTLFSKILPLLLSSSIITSFMYIYDKSNILIFSLAGFVISLGIFLFYDFFSSKGVVGKYCSILGGFAVIVLLYFMAASGGSSDDGIDFMLWFMSPQSAVEYSLQYTLTLFIGITFFIASTVYYFTQVRYRIFVTFLIMMIPLAIFAKEDEKIPTILLAMLLVSYLSVMVHCRQTAESEKDSKVRMILDTSYRKSVAFFIFITVIISFIFPKPEIEADRTYFESMISANGITQYLLSRLGEFSDTSSGMGFSMGSSDARLFLCYSEEPMNLKTKTFSYYNRPDDTWYLNASYDRYFMSGWENEKELLNPAVFMDAVYEACEYDSEFAEKYGIEYKNPEEYDLSDFERTMTVFPQRLIMSFLPVPSHTFIFSQDDFLMSPNGTAVKYSYEDESEQKIYSSVTVSYYSDMLSDVEYARGIMENLNTENYMQFLSELYAVLLQADTDSETLEMIEIFIDDYKNAFSYHNEEELKTDSDSFIYKHEVNEYDTEYTVSRELKELAEEITEDCYSDIEKAEAIERYFFVNNYVYDADYRKAEGSDIDTFVFTDKKGACYEYATAMILMARSVGIPARYNEGFMLSDYDDEIGAYIVTSDNSHAFPELFISGYGWLGFEPTVTDDIQNTEKGLTDEQLIITLICIGAVLLFIGCILFAKFVYPVIYEKYFRLKVSRMTAEDSAVMILKRLRKLSDTEKSVTADEFTQYFIDRYNTDISMINDIFNMYVYGGIRNSNSNVNTVMEIYVKAYESMRENKKKL